MVLRMDTGPSCTFEHLEVGFQGALNVAKFVLLHAVHDTRARENLLEGWRWFMRGLSARGGDDGEKTQE